MKLHFLSFLRCPDCRGELALTPTETLSQQIDEDILRCSKCSESYPLIEGIPILLPQKLLYSFVQDPSRRKRLNFLGFKAAENQITLSHEIQSKIMSSANWGNQRKDDLFMYDDGGKSEFFGKKGFLDELQIQEADLKVKSVLDVCCGGGRGLVHSLSLAKQVIGLDISETVFVLKKRFEKLYPDKDFLLIQGDACALPFDSGVFQFVYSQRALHHLPNFDIGLREVHRVTKASGNTAFSVYSRENNEVMVYLIEPFRKLVYKLFGTAGLQIAAFSIASILFPILKLYRLLFSKIKVPFVYHDLFNHWGDTNFLRFYINIIFDLLQAPTAFYLHKNDISSSLKPFKLKHTKFFLQFKTVWCVHTLKDGN